MPRSLVGQAVARRVPRGRRRSERRMPASPTLGYAQSLLDLFQAFESVPHRRVVEAARKHGYKLWLLRLSLASYRLRRTVGVDGTYSQLRLAARGVTAGSGFTTFGLRVLLMDVVDGVRNNWAWVSVSLYVDDMVISSAGPGKQAAIDVAGAIRHLGLQHGTCLLSRRGSPRPGSLRR
jgi:hypothetical protein